MPMYDLIIKNGTIVTPDSTFEGDIAIQDGKITKVVTDNSLENDAADTIDAEGLHVLPGLIDPHVHFNEPGRTEWEGLETGSQSLAAGGATTFFDMPLNSTPPVIDQEKLNAKKDLAAEKSVVNAHFWGGLVPGNVAELKDMHDRGVIGFKAFMPPSGIEDFDNTDDETIFTGMQEIARLGSRLAVHAESPVICEQLAKEKQRQGKTSARDFAESRPIISEIDAVNHLISYAEATGCKLHIVHASSRKVVNVVKDAQARGVDVTVETCPHYLALTLKDLEEQGGIAKCMPPLRDSHEVDDLWNAVLEGEVNVIGSDHSPAPADMKQITDNYFEGWGGISGAQSTLNILLTEGYFKRGLTLQRLVQLTSASPAKLFGLSSKGTIAAGFDADITLVNLNERFELKKEDLFYRHKHSPYIGKTYQGAVKTTIVNGRVVYHNGEITVH
ncbi:allantoinase [Lentibacillus amyloliquefaciens]|uniref:Allantoinase n=1 Tax=Lentibacillus amyloliquefaciens TaxID=1472767 RepID=A0A0U4DT20_9BACI|nr:allantoinase [Lentibacillus amyloliquefaciens]ALX48488.1 cyclic amidohydrolase [Lentibacillus amyloliquefaciens]